MSAMSAAITSGLSVRAILFIRSLTLIFYDIGGTPTGNATDSRCVEIFPIDRSSTGRRITLPWRRSFSSSCVISFRPISSTCAINRPRSMRFAISTSPEPSNQNLQALSIFAKENIHVALIHNGIHLMNAVAMKFFKTAAHVDFLSVNENTKTFSI